MECHGGMPSRDQVATSQDGSESQALSRGEAIMFDKLESRVSWSTTDAVGGHVIRGRTREDMPNATDPSPEGGGGSAETAQMATPSGWWTPGSDHGRVHAQLIMQTRCSRWIEPNRRRERLMLSSRSRESASGRRILVPGDQLYGPDGDEALQSNEVRHQICCRLANVRR